MTKFQKFKIIFLFSISCFLLFYTFSVSAAELFFETETEKIGISQQFQVDLLIDTENEDINAIGGKIKFPAELLELKEIRDGDSIIPFWVDKPLFNKETSEILFSGIIPAGFEGVLSSYYEGARPGKILSLIFLAKNIGSDVINIEDAKVLLNDGKGTETKTTISEFHFGVVSETLPMPTIPTDNEPPESFKPEAARDPNIFDNKWFLVFAAQDKISGIDYYEILEKGQPGSFQELIKREKWQTGESPYLLKDQKLKSHIYVKVIDKAGNERIATLSPRNLLKWYEKWWPWGIIILSAIIIGYIFRKALWPRLHTK